MRPHLYADFQNVDADGRIRMNSVGTSEDLARLRLTLSNGLAVELYTDDGDSDRGLIIPATIEFNEGERIWAAAVDWSQLVRGGHESVSRVMAPTVGR